MDMSTEYPRVPPFSGASTRQFNPVNASLRHWGLQAHRPGFRMGRMGRMGPKHSGLLGPVFTFSVQRQTHACPSLKQVKQHQHHTHTPGPPTPNSRPPKKKTRFPINQSGPVLQTAADQTSAGCSVRRTVIGHNRWAIWTILAAHRQGRPHHPSSIVHGPWKLPRSLQPVSSLFSACQPTSLPAYQPTSPFSRMTEPIFDSPSVPKRPRTRDGTGTGSGSGVALAGTAPGLGVS